MRSTTGSDASLPRTGSVAVRRSHSSEQAAEGVDRRRAPRARFATFVRISVGARHIDGRSETISTSGLSALVKEDLPENTAATARFSLPVTETMVSLPCRTVHAGESRNGGYLIGLSFEVSTSEVQNEIRQFVEAFGEIPPET